MALTDTFSPLTGDTRGRHCSASAAITVCVAAVLALSSCGVGGDPVEAGASVSSTDVETSTCPDWADDIVAPAPADTDVDADGLRQHFLDRSAAIFEVAEQLPADDAAVFVAYADAVRDFGMDPISPGASRRMGEAAADAAAVAHRSC